MKKGVKIFLGIIVILILLIVIDFICIFNIGRPLFAFKKSYGVYSGLFYDTYNCSEFSIPQIKSKSTKFSCIMDINFVDIIDIVDKTESINNFSCAEMLESFYEDDNYIYFWSCLKDKYMVVKYENGFEEPVSVALNNNRISIEDLDNYNINYIKEEK